MKLPCLFCGDNDATTTVDVNDGATMVCTACDHEFTAKDAADRLEKLNTEWNAVLGWLAKHPARSKKA